MKYKFFKKLGSVWFWVFVAIVLSVFLLIVDHIYQSEWLGMVSNVLQVFTVAFAVFAWIDAKNALNRRMDAIDNAKSDKNSVIMVVDLKSNPSSEVIKFGKGIISQVREYIKDQGILSVSETDSPTVLPGVAENFQVELYAADRLINFIGGDMPDTADGAINYIDAFENTLNTTVQRIRNNGATTILLFCSAPIVISYFIGSNLKNNFHVVIYHYSNNKRTYIPLN